MTLCSLSTVFLCEDGGCVVKEVCLKHYAMRNEPAILFLIIKMNVLSVFLHATTCYIPILNSQESILNITRHLSCSNQQIMIDLAYNKRQINVSNSK